MDLLGRQLLLLALAWCAILVPAHGAGADAVELAYDSFMEVHEQTRGWSTADRESEIASAFDERFSSYFENISAQLSDHKVGLLFAAANIAHAYSIRDIYLEKMVDAFDVLQARELMSERIYADMYGALVASRRFDQATQLAARFPQWPAETLPTLRREARAGRTALKVTGSAALKQVPIEVEKGPRVVVISHPLCHFSQRAVTAIEQDAALSKALAGSLWLAPVDRKLYLEVLNQWNQTHTAHKIMIAYNRAQWAELKSWSTPTFYFFNDGQLVSVVEGWPSEGNREKVLLSARQIGL